MTFVRTFTKVKPAPRGDGIPFTIVLVDEGTTSLGAWVTIDSFDLAADTIPAGLDTNPMAPLERTFTTALATLDPDAWYRLRWVDASSAQYTSPPIHVASPVLSIVENLTRSELPLTWDSLATDSANIAGGIGIDGLRLRVQQTKNIVLPTVIAQLDEITYPAALQSYLAKRAALDLIPTGIEYWMRRGKIAKSATGTNETLSYPDPVNALKALADRLTVEVAQLAADPNVIPQVGTLTEAPAVSNDGDALTEDPFEYPPAFQASGTQQSATGSGGASASSGGAGGET